MQTRPFADIARPGGINHLSDQAPHNMGRYRDYSVASHRHLRESVAIVATPQLEVARGSSQDLGHLVQVLAGFLDPYDVRHVARETKGS